MLAGTMSFFFTTVNGTWHTHIRSSISVEQMHKAFIECWLHFSQKYWRRLCEYRKNDNSLPPKSGVYDLVKTKRLSQRCHSLYSFLNSSLSLLINIQATLKHQLWARRWWEKEAVERVSGNRFLYILLVFLFSARMQFVVSQNRNT